MFTFVVISCNRLYYLKNCISSIMEFVGLDDIHLLVVDNHSVEIGTREYLESLPSSVAVKYFSKRIPNELHRAMNFGISYAKGKGDKYVNFIQEDYQFLYRQPDLLRKVADAFDDRKDVVQLQTNLIWKRKHKKIGKVTKVIVKGTKWLLLHDKPPCDNGFTRVSLYDKIGLYPKRTSIHGKERGYRSGESWFASKCKRYKRMLLSRPNLGMMMDCAFVRGNERRGRYFSPPGKYFLKPFDAEKQKKVKEMSIRNKFCFIEDLIEPDGWVPDSMKLKHNMRKIRRQLQ